MTNAAANTEQVKYWNQVGGPKWVLYQAMLDHQLDEVGELALQAAALAPGDAVLDVGCGCGSTTLELARRVGPAGRATGIDVSRPMLELARRRAADDGVANAAFEEADAQSFAFRREFDVLFSRFGVMFFDDPVRAFTNLRTALKPDARVAFVCWQALPRNAWMARPLVAAMQHVTLEAPPDPHAPGPFAFADDERVRGILHAAGFRDAATRAVDVELTVGGGGDVDSAVDFLLDLGPLARALPALPDAKRAEVAGAVRDAIAGFAVDDGVRMPGAVWVVTARA